MRVLKTGELSASVTLRNQRNTDTFDLVKQSTGHRDFTGEWVVSDAPVVIPDLVGVIQPLDGRSRNDLPEGERLSDAISVMYNTTDRETVSAMGDKIIYADQEWVVRVVNDMTIYGHIEVYAVRVGAAQ